MQEKKGDSGKLLLTAVIVIIVLIGFGVVVSNEGSNLNQASSNAVSQVQPTPQATPQDTAQAQPQSTSLYAPVTIAMLAKNVDQPSFEGNGGGTSASLVEVKGVVSKTFPNSHDNDFLLQDSSGNVLLIGLGAEQGGNAKASQIKVGANLTIDGIFIGDVQSLINTSGNNLPPDYSFLATLPPTTPYVSW